MSGLFNDDTLSLYLKLKEAMKQYVRDAMPGGSLNAEVPNYPQMMADQAKAQQNTLRDAWGDPNKMADATLGMMNGAMGSFLPFGMTAWHGSPHKFDKFDLSKIGTGEGAQAYGHGAYLAEAKDVGKEYARKLANVDSSGYANAQLNAQNLVQRFNGDKEWAKEVVKDQLASVEKTDPNFKRLTDTLSVLEGKAPQQLGSTGHLYKTDIPDEAVARFLDWDKPLSQQSNGALTQARAYIDANIEKAGREAESIIAGAKGRKPTAEEIAKVNALRAQQAASRGDLDTAGGMYQRLTSDLGSQDAATKYLQDLGIPGIRYLDGGSRGAGTGTSNFVVFDPEMIRILERNGVATGAKPWQPGEWEGLFKK